MKRLKGYKKSHFIASVATLLIHLVLLLLLNINFGEEQSSALSDLDLYDMDLSPEELMAEDFELKPAGKDPTAAQNDKESQSISKENGSVKKTVSEPQIAEQPQTEEHIPVLADTVVKKIETVQLLKVDTLKIDIRDSALIADLAKTNKDSKSKTTSRQFSSERERYQYYLKNYKIIRNFKKVYPYALKTREIIEDLNARLATMSSETEKRKMIKETEKMLFQEYESAVRTMSTSQGKLLLKLIARETNKTAFDLIKDYKGGFSASFWFGVGKIFGTDLKSEFHKEREDSLIEEVLVKYKKNDLYQSK